MQSSLALEPRATGCSPAARVTCKRAIIGAEQFQVNRRDLVAEQARMLRHAASAVACGTTVPQVQVVPSPLQDAATWGYAAVAK
jgi:hypothetical protein